MATGITFTDEDFEDIELTAADDAANALLWGHNNEKTITSELAGLQTRINNFCGLLAKAVESCDYYTTYNAWVALFTNDLGPAGWIPSFVEVNREDFTGTSAPYIDGGSEAVKAYAAVDRFFKELVTLNEACTRLNELIPKFQFDACYNRLSTTRNFKRSGKFDMSLYGQIDVDIEFFSWQLSRKLTDIPDIKAAGFYRSYQDSLISGGTALSPFGLRQKYRHERTRDFQEDIRKRGTVCLMERSDGPYALRADWDSLMCTIDGYTKSIVKANLSQDALKQYIDDCKKVTNETLIPLEKELKRPETLSVMAAFRHLVQAVQKFTQDTIDDSQKYYDAKEAPYCFMENPGALSSVSPKYSFNPKKDWPWDHGTSLQELYQMAVKALNEQMNDYVTKAGESHLQNSD